MVGVIYGIFNIACNIIPLCRRESDTIEGLKEYWRYRNEN